MKFAKTSKRLFKGYVQTSSLIDLAPTSQTACELSNLNAGSASAPVNHLPAAFAIFRPGIGLLFLLVALGAGAQIYAPAKFSYPSPVIFVAGTTASPISPVSVPAGTITILSSSLSYPFGVAVDNTGNIYVADGGASAVVQITPSGTSTNLGSGFNGPLGVAVDAAGNVFVADAGNNAVKEVTVASGYTAVKVLGSGFNNPTGVALDAAGNVFVADANNANVKEITKASGYTTVDSLSTPFNFPTGVAFDAAGNLFVADGGANAVVEVNAATGAIIGTFGSGFNNPTAVAVDLLGNVYVADQGNNAVKELTAVSGYTSIKTIGKGFSSPAGVAVDAAGDVFVADAGNGAVEEISGTGGKVSNYTVEPILPAGLLLDPSTGIISGTPASARLDAVYYVTASNASGTVKTSLTITIANPYAPAKFTYTSPNNFTVGNTINPLLPSTALAGTITTPGSGFGYPYGVAVDSSGNLFVADGGTSTVVQIYPDGTTNTLGSGFNGPLGTAVDAKGNVFVADAGNNAIKEITAASKYTTVKTLGSGFNNPTGVALDATGNVYVADAGTGEIKKITAASGYTTVTIVGPGFGFPTGVTVDASGNVYVADKGNNAVYEITAASSYADTTAIGSGFNNPTGVAVDVTGNVYVADQGNNAVKEITAASGYSTTKTLGSGFSSPSGVAVDAAGDVFVADANNGLVKEIASAGGTVSTYSIKPLLPPGLVLNATTGIINGTPTATSPTTLYTVTASNAGGNASDTVTITVTNGTLAVTFAGITATPFNGGVQVKWQTLTEQGTKNYVLQKSADGLGFATVYQTPALNNGAPQTYTWFDAQPFAGDNYYRVQVINNDGTESYSRVVMVKITGVQQGFSVYPNPAQSNGQLQALFTNMPAGKYVLTVYSINGKAILRQTIQHAGGTAVQTVTLPAGLDAGSYRVVLSDGGKGNSWKLQLQVQ